MNRRQLTSFQGIHLNKSDNYTDADGDCGLADEDRKSAIEKLAKLHLF